MQGNQLPRIATEIPGPQSRQSVDVLAQHECPAITTRRSRRADALGRDHDDPIVWSEAVGANVLDVDGNRYVDLTSGFGVALVGHRHPDVVAAAKAQCDTLLHAMGDAWPDASRIVLLKQLSEITPKGLDVAILGLSGADAVDIAVKTAILATQKPGVLCFEGGYHGLSLGTVALQGYKRGFTDPFRSVVHPQVHHLPWACDMALVEQILTTQSIGLVLAEPIQGRGGIRTPPPQWLSDLAQTSRTHGALFALDEIQTGLGRTGTLFAGPALGVIPDLMCVGKALGGGFPISACVGSRQVMDAWGVSEGEAIHTQTFLGHPIGCAAASAVLTQIANGLPEQALSLGEHLSKTLRAAGFPCRGRGLMWGVSVSPSALEVSRRLLSRGFLALPAGMQGEVLCLTPPVCLTHPQWDAFLRTLSEVAQPGAALE